MSIPISITTDASDMAVGAVLQSMPVKANARLLFEDTISIQLITTSFGLYKFLRMPFGLKNAVQSFQRLMDTVCQGLDFTFTYIRSALSSNLRFL